jgi:hypothetical protein
MSGRPKDPIRQHGDNLAPGWRCNYCGMQKSGGSTRFKQHLAALRSLVLHCSRVPPPVRECDQFLIYCNGVTWFHKFIDATGKSQDSDYLKTVTLKPVLIYYQTLRMSWEVTKCCAYFCKRFVRW